MPDSGIAMKDTKWSHPYSPHEPQDLVAKQQMAWHVLLDRYCSKLLGKVKGLLPWSPGIRKAKRKNQNTYRRLDASEESASDEATSPGSEFIRFKAGQ